MKVTISFKHLEHTPSLDEKIHSKSEKFKKYFDGNFEVQWTCYTQGQDQWAEIKLIGPSFTYHAKGKADSLYKTLDIVSNKLEKQLQKKKGKWKEHIHHKHDDPIKSIPINDMIKDEDDYQEYLEEESA